MEKFINPFIYAVKEVLHQIIGIEPNIQELKILNNTQLFDEIVVSVGFFGDASGEAFFGMSHNTALNLARKMMCDNNICDLDFICENAIKEVGNMVTGVTGRECYSNGVDFDILPPKLYKDSTASTITSNDYVHIPIKFENFGDINLNISFN